jgi:pimeloyl-ACP methyl ester carboxylesterase
MATTQTKRRYGAACCAFLVLGLPLLALTACARAPSRPDFARLYAASERGYEKQPPVILLHGVLGAKLRKADGEEVWPGGLRRLAFSQYRNLALPIDAQTLMPVADELEPYAIFDSAAGSDFYGAIVRTLRDSGGYRAGQLGERAKRGEKRYYVFLYDWRRDNIDSVRALDALIERIRADYANPALRVDIVAHSNGGLIARYYARYGTQDLLDGNDFPVTQAGAKKIRRLILLGTPNFGSVSAITAFAAGMKVGFRRIPPEVLMTMPSAYQLFPHALNTWVINGRGEPLDRDVFDSELWRRFEWGVYNADIRQRVLKRFKDPAQGVAYLATLERYFHKYLERARRFTWALTVQEPVRGIRPIVLGGDCEFTPARVLVEDIDGDSVLRLFPKDIARPLPGVNYEALMLEPGDGTVTKASLLARESVDPTVPRHEYSHFPLDYSFFLCERHDQLTGNLSFQDNLLHALLSVDR